MPRPISKAACDALAATDWSKVDAMTDEDIARQIASNPDAAPDMSPEIDVRAIRQAAGMTQAQFAAAYEFSVRTVQEWERGAKRPAVRIGLCCGRSRAIRRGCGERWRRRKGGLGPHRTHGRKLTVHR